MKKFRKIMAVLVAAIMVVAMTVPAWAASITIKQTPSEGTAGSETYLIYKIFDATKTASTVGNTTDETNKDHYSAVNSGAEISSEAAFNTAKANAPGQKLYSKGADGKYTEAPSYPGAAGVFYQYNEEKGIAYTITNTSATNEWFDVLFNSDGSAKSGQEWVTATETTKAGEFNVKWEKDYSQASAEEFANWLLANKGSITNTYSMNVLNGGKTTTTVADGYYLVTSSLGTKLVLATSDIEITTKNSYPTTEKEAGAENYNMGDFVKFSIDITIPASSRYDTTITIHDTMDDVLSLVQGKASVPTANGWKAYVDDDTSKDITEKVTLVTSFGDGHSTSHTNEDNKTEFDFVLDLNSNLLKPSGSEAPVEHTVTIEYYAELRNEAAIDTTYTNKEFIEYSKYESTPVNDTIQTYGFKVKKEFDGTHTSSTSATFELHEATIAQNGDGEYYKLKTGEYTTTAPTASNLTTDYECDTTTDPSNPTAYTYAVTPGAVIEFKKPSSDTTLYKRADSTDASGDRTSNVEAAADVETKMQGLKAGIYTLVETDTADGYQVLTAPIILEIKNNGDAYILSAPTQASGITINQDATRVNLMTITNETSSVLPSTGGMGTTVLYIVGGMLVILAGAYLFFSRKKMA